MKSNQFLGILVTGFCSVIDVAFGSSDYIDILKDGNLSAHIAIIDNILDQNSRVSPSLLFFLPSINIICN